MTKKNTMTKLAPLFLGCIVSLNGYAVTAMTLVDSNGDGVISAEEIKSARALVQAEVLAQYDTNGDGELSKDERKIVRSDRRSELLATYDADGNGELSRDERRTAREALRASVKAQLDVNQDGELSDAERAGMEEVRESLESRRGGRGKSGGGRDKG